MFSQRSAATCLRYGGIHNHQSSCSKFCAESSSKRIL